MLVPAAPASNAADKPNFVVIFCDDLGYGDLGCYGHPTIRTPQLDRMAAEGVRFTDFYSAASVCTPSRAALLTGRLPIRGGMQGQTRRVLFPDSERGLPADEITLAEALVTAGYATACIGKWHLGHRHEYLPLRHGFEHYFGIPYSNDMRPNSRNPQSSRWPPLPLIRDDTTIETEPDQRLLTERYTDAAITFIRQQKAEPDGRPFFLYLAHTMPHVPIFASDRFAGKSARGLYGDVVETIDWSTGEILRTLREMGLAENTLVLFTSDNGPWLLQRQAGGSAGLLREGKGSSWEGGMRVPCIAVWPGRIPRGVDRHAVASTLDIFPTALALAGVPLPNDRAIDGQDLSPVLFGNGEVPERPFFYYRGGELMAVRRGPWKMHFKTQAGYAQPQPDVHDPPLLFHLGHDPGEQYNVAKDHPEAIAELTRVAQEHQSGVKPVEPQY